MPNPGPATTITPNTLYGGSATEGFQIGSTSQSKLTAYGVSPAVVQRFSANQAAVSSGAVGGTLITMMVSTVVPSSGTITNNTVSSVAVTFASQGLITAISVDFLIVNKPAATANVGICGAIISTVSTVLIQYINPSVSQATPTAGESYVVANLRGLGSTVTLSPPVTGISSITETLYTVTGVAVGDLLAVQKPTHQSYLGVVGMRVAANNQIGISLINLSSQPVTATASEAWTYVALKQLHANSNIMVAQINTSAAPLTLTAGGLNTVTMSVTGLSVSTDIPLSVNRTTGTTTYAPISARVSAVNVLELTYLSAGTGAGFAAATGSVVTPSNFEILTVPFIRQNAAAPLVVQQVTLTPTAIGVLACTEVPYAVSNITVSTVLWVNKTSFTPNIGIVGCRTISTDVIGITYVNNSSATITPPVEVYTIGNFKNILGLTHQLQQQVQTAAVASVALTNEVRAALVALGFIGGS